MRLLIAFFILFSGFLSAESLKKEGVTVELVSENSSIQPGRTFCIGLVFRHEPGFHTYWRQPGIVGLAPALKWTLPAGFAAGDIIWPEPERVTMSKWGAWGFKRDVCLVVEITPARNLDSSGTPTVTFFAKASWMCCSQTCHPGFADLSLTLPVSNQSGSTSPFAPLFAATRAEQPVEPKDWRFNASQTADGFTLRITPPRGQRVPGDAYFFGFARLVDSHAPQKSRLQKDGALLLDLKLTELPEKNVTSLDGLLWSAKGWPPVTSKRTMLVRASLAER